MRDLVALLIVVFVLVFGTRAHADTVSFFCKSEEMINNIADALTTGGQQKADIVAEPYLALGECQYTPEPLFIYIVSKGTTFGDKFKVTVVGISRKIGELPEMWGMIETSTLSEQLGTI